MMSNLDVASRGPKWPLLARAEHSLALAAKVCCLPGATDARVHVGREIASKMARLAEEAHGNVLYFRYRRLAAPS